MTPPSRKRTSSQSSQNAPSEKRLKSDDEESKKNAHRRFWFDDGNVVIHVEGQDFRLHSSILKSRSSYFANLFSQNAAGSDAAQEPIEGCPVYKIDGSRIYFLALLDGLYGNLFTTDRTPSFLTLACFLRAAHHWNFPSCKSWAVKELTRRLPFTLKDFNQAEYPEPAKIIVLCRAAGVTSLLKPAFYGLMGQQTLGLELPKPVKGEDKPHSGNADSDDDALSEIAEDGDAPGDNKEYNFDPEVEWNDSEGTLSPDDMTRAIHLLEFTTQEWMRVSRKSPSYAFLSDKTTHESRTIDCRKIFRKIWHSNVTEADFAEKGWFNPLSALEEIKAIDWEGKGICDGCALKCRVAWEAERKSIWDNMDKELGIVDD
ncbi:hypothetical protein BOTBODRAFT_36432 [Botryobasidium botryosum FD-172 SS1]|uniref:BTB domain-containing protein n=1 Tax=Botryobasidium botryosum (strain FD-172 SS1) TaxID=930990 RepID=A0A067M3J6_BOTB1|nr:hypothetical protein BOTBODRAFT_36432 [Botryobasidium botryosum FD-172 SS1]